METIPARIKFKAFVESKGKDIVKERLDCSNETIRRYINGERTPSDLTKVEIENLTGGVIPIIDWFPSDDLLSNSVKEKNHDL